MKRFKQIVVSSLVTAGLAAGFTAGALTPANAATPNKATATGLAQTTQHVPGIDARFEVTLP